MNEKIKKTTIRIPDGLHKKIKKHLIDLELSLQEYVLELIIADLDYGFLEERKKTNNIEDRLE